VIGEASGTRAEPHVVIIGGGIAGLSAALRLRALNSPCRITIVDAAATLGGKITGEVVDGCVVDGGPDVCIGERLRATHMFTDLALESRVVAVNPGNLPTYERRAGELREFPTRFAGELLTFPRGLHELIEIVQQALDDVTVRTDAPVSSIAPDKARWLLQFPDAALPVATTVATTLADAVIVATPAPVAAALLSPVVPIQAAALRALEYPPTTTVTMAWRSGDVHRALDGTGYLAARGDTSRVSACTWVSSKNPSHSPNGIVLLRGYVRGAGDDPAELMRQEVAATMGITAAPLFTRVHEWPAGIPLYTPAHEAAVRALEESLTSAPGVFIAGSAFHGVGVPDCIASGERAAAAAATHLSERKTEEAA